jgi:hypothetical protein
MVTLPFIIGVRCALFDAGYRQEKKEYEEELKTGEEAEELSREEAEGGEIQSGQKEGSAAEQNKEKGNGSTIPAGTYRGKTDMPDNLSAVMGVGLPGKILHNEITVIISDDGTVTGGLIVTCFSDAYRLPDNEVDYTFFTDISTSGNITGSITDADGGTIKIKMTESWKTRYGGDIKHMSPALEERSFDLKADVHISDYDMYGYVDGYRTIFTFKALKD